jgi:CheY-like chemotaxis protein
METPTILYADDDENDLLLMKRVFRALRLESYLNTVDDGAKVISYLEGTGEFADRSRYPFPQMLILDNKMPRMSGDEVIQWLKAQLHLPRLLVVRLGSEVKQGPTESLFEQHGNIVLFNAGLVKPPRLESMEDLLSLYHNWQRRHLLR